MIIKAAHGTIAAAEYAPAAGARAVEALLVVAPGSGGGLGPGLAIHPQPWGNIRRMSAHGGPHSLSATARCISFHPNSLAEHVSNG